MFKLPLPVEYYNSPEDLAEWTKTLMSERTQHDIEPSLFFSHLTVQNKLKQLKEDAEQDEIRLAILGHDVEDLYKYMDLIHNASNKPLSEVFPQDLIDSTPKILDYVSVTKQLSNLCMSLRMTNRKYMDLEAQLKQETAQHAEAQQLLNTNKIQIQKLQHELENYKTKTLDNRLSDNGLNTIFNTATLSGKLNIVFVAITSMLIIGILINMVLKHKHNSQKNIENKGINR